MDPTAPKDDPNQKDPNREPLPKSPIQPGQFVVAPPAEDTTIPPQPRPEDSQSLAGEQPPQESSQPSQLIPQEESAPLFAQDQPNPTPYVAPTPTPEMAQASTEPPPSRIQRARKILIIVGILLLVAILGAIVWLFIVGRSREQPAKTQSQEVSPGQEPSQPPIPKRTTGGFADLPVATRESQATASASPKP